MESFQLGYHLQTKLLLLSRNCNLFTYQNLNLVVLEAYIFSLHLKRKIAALPKIFHNTAPAIILKELLALFQEYSSSDLRCGTILCTGRSPPEKNGVFYYINNSCFDYVLIQITCFGFLCLKAYFC